MTVSTATTDFVAAQRVNRRNTFLLLAILTLLAASLGYLIGWVLSFDDAAPGPWSGGGVIGAGLMATASIGWSLVSLATSDRMVLGMASAKDIDRMCKSSASCFGTPEEVAPAVQQFADAGVDQLVFGMLSTTMSREIACEAVTTFGKHLLP